MKDSTIHGIGIVSCTLIAGLCIFGGRSYVNHLNENADYSIESTRLAISSMADSQSDKSVVIPNDVADKDVPERIIVDGVEYLYVDEKSSIDSELLSKLNDDDTILIVYRGAVYVTSDTYTKYVQESPSEDSSAKADKTAEGDNKKQTNNEYIVLDVDGNQIYLVKKGDTLTDVSARISYSVDEIAEYNHIKDVNLIYAGETLRVPVSATESDAE